jgi:hypothetical protein
VRKANAPIKFKASLFAPPARFAGVVNSTRFRQETNPPKSYLSHPMSLTPKFVASAKLGGGSVAYPRAAASPTGRESPHGDARRKFAETLKAPIAASKRHERRARSFIPLFPPRHRPLEKRIFSLHIFLQLFFIF